MKRTLKQKQKIGIVGIGTVGQILAQVIPGEGKKIIVIKSTVLPGTTEKMQKKYPQHKVLFNPEFLREDYAEKDMRSPGQQIAGYTIGENVFLKILNHLSA